MGKADFLAPVLRAKAHLEALRVEVVLRPGRPCQEAEVLALHPALADLYRCLGEGFAFGWEAGEEGPGGLVELPPIVALMGNTSEVTWRMEFQDDYDFPHTSDPALARKTALRMRAWLRFTEEGNGDSLAFDPLVEGCPIVYDQHDWYDGGSGENGARFADTLLESWAAWASVCFQSPLWWGDVMWSGRIDWASGEFEGEYRVAAEG